MQFQLQPSRNMSKYHILKNTTDFHNHGVDGCDSRATNASTITAATLAVTDENTSAEHHLLKRENSGYPHNIIILIIILTMHCGVKLKKWY